MSAIRCGIIRDDDVDIRMQFKSRDQRGDELGTEQGDIASRNECRIDLCPKSREPRNHASQRAAFGNPKPNSRQFLRLSSAYLLVGQRAAAERAAERAVELGEGQIRQLALQQLQEIRARSRK